MVAADEPHVYAGKFYPEYLENALVSEIALSRLAYGNFEMVDDASSIRLFFDDGFFSCSRYDADFYEHMQIVP